MKVFIVLTICAFAAFSGLFPALTRAEEPRFFTEMNDIPLMPGLYELTGETMVFDKPEGRIIESSAVGESAVSPINASQIKAFYAASLPQLGWISAPEQAGRGWTDSYVRESEILRFRVDSKDSLNILRMQVSPRS